MWGAFVLLGLPTHVGRVVLLGLPTHVARVVLLGLPTHVGRVVLLGHIVRLRRLVLEIARGLVVHGCTVLDRFALRLRRTVVTLRRLVADVVRHCRMEVPTRSATRPLRHGR